jgi:P4 family phage/plasmid primase-like protien
VRWKGEVYVYREGRWTGGDDAEAMMDQHIRERYYALGLNGKFVMPVLGGSVKAQVRMEAPPVEPVDGILFRNGLFRWARNDDGRHVPEFTPAVEGEVPFARYTLPYDFPAELLAEAREKGWHPFRLMPPAAMRAFAQWNARAALLLLELIGYATFTSSYIWHRAVMLVGEGSNGKSTYLQLVRDLFAPHMVGLSLQTISGPEGRFQLAKLRSALVNVFADLPREPIKYTGWFKVLTGEDVITADRKNREPVEFVNTAKMFFAANELPMVHDTSDAFFRRWIVIEFPHQFEPDPNFYTRTFPPEDRPKILAAGILAFEHALRRGGFSEGGKGSSAAEYREYWMRETNSVYAWLQERIEEGRLVRDPMGSITIKEVYEDYVDWCGESEEEPVSKKAFSGRLEQLGFKRGRTVKERLVLGLRRAGGAGASTSKLY